MRFRFWRRAPKPGTHADFPDLAPKQLMMAAPKSVAADLRRPPLPAGYSLRTYRAGDDDGWVALLVRSGFAEWDREKFIDFMAQPERRAGSHVVEHDGQLVAATFASRKQLEPAIGAVDYVVCLPEHRGRRLGALTTVVVMQYLFDHGYEAIILATDDERMPALKVYLDIGFRPVLNRLDMAPRWLDITNALDSKTEGTTR